MMWLRRKRWSYRVACWRMAATSLSVHALSSLTTFSSSTSLLRKLKRTEVASLSSSSAVYMTDAASSPLTRLTTTSRKSSTDRRAT